MPATTDNEADAFCAWLRDNKRGGWIRAFVSLRQAGAGPLVDMTAEDLVAIFTRLGPLPEPDASDAVAVAAADAAADALVAMFAGLSV
jgi:hypothetical protein